MLHKEGIFFILNSEEYNCKKDAQVKTQMLFLKVIYLFCHFFISLSIFVISKITIFHSPSPNPPLQIELYCLSTGF